MPLASPAPNGRCTYGDYCTWADDQRWELVDGEAWAMTPAPSTEHQSLVVTLAAALHGHLRGTGCRVLVAPTDLLLPRGSEADEAVDTVLQPDLLVVCDLRKVTRRHVRGAPDLVAEVLSPSTAWRDEGVKRDLYQRAGVPEYWLVHPGDRTVLRYRQTDRGYGAPDVYGPEDGELVSTRFSDFRLDLRELFGPGEAPAAPEETP